MAQNDLAACLALPLKVGAENRKGLLGDVAFEVVAEIDPEIVQSAVKTAAAFQTRHGEGLRNVAVLEVVLKLFVGATLRRAKLRLFVPVGQHVLERGLRCIETFNRAVKVRKSPSRKGVEVRRGLPAFVGWSLHLGAGHSDERDGGKQSHSGDFLH